MAEDKKLVEAITSMEEISLSGTQMCVRRQSLCLTQASRDA